jgi:hypothetical protein
MKFCMKIYLMSNNELLQMFLDKIFLPLFGKFPGISGETTQMNCKLFTTQTFRKMYYRGIVLNISNTET